MHIGPTLKSTHTSFEWA